MTNILKTLMLLILVAALPLRAAADDGIAVTLAPENVRLGGSAIMKLVIQGSRSANPVLPEVDGLAFESAGQNSQFSWINGKMSSSVTLVYRVVPTREGEFKIPPITCQIDGKNMQTPPLTLKVVKDSGSGNAEQASNQEEKSSTIFGRITGVPEKMYVGQVVPATVNFYINRRTNLQINQIGLPVLKGDAFSAAALKPDEIKQTNEVIDGVQYFVIRATVALTAIKEGEFELSAHWPLTVITVEDAGGNDPFDDPFFRGMLRRRVEKPLSVNSSKLTVSVQALPADGRPESFAGAVGNFNIKLSAEPHEVRVGDPLTMKVELRGSGNFDRISAPKLANAKGWKSYPASAQFVPADSAGIEGVKTFTQALIPQDALVKELPTVEFTYFDPLTIKYVTLSPESPMVAILPPEQGAALTQVSAPVDGKEAAAGSPLAPLRLEIGALQSTWQPLVSRPWFVALQGAPLLLGLAGFFLLMRHRRQVADPEYQLRKIVDKNVLHALHALDSALANEDSAAFAEAAGRALRERLAGLWNLRAASLTTADIRYRLGANGGEIVALFEAADAVTYAGRRLSRAEMFDFKKRVLEQLNQLER